MMNSYFLKKPYETRTISLSLESKALVKKVNLFFSNLLKQKIIYNYKFLDTKSCKDTINFIWIYYPRKNIKIEVHIDLDNNSKTGFFREVLRKARILIVKIGLCVSVDKILKAISGFINKVKRGLDAENRLKKCLEVWKWTPNEMLSFFLPTEKEDKAGVDGYLVYTNHEDKYITTVPLQIKSSKKYQKIHMKLHPRIPSICLVCSNEVLVKNLFRIVKAYRKNMIIHI